MKANRFFIAEMVALTMLATGTIAPAAGEGGPKDVDEAWTKAMRANDVEAVVACYAPDAIGWFPGENQAKGTDEIRAVYKRLLGENTVTEVELTDTHYETHGERGIGWGRFKMTLTPKAGGAPTVMAGRFTEVTKPMDGRWVYAVDHASADPMKSEEKAK